MSATSRGSETGERPLVVGMNGDRYSSWLAFYRSRAMARGVAVGNTGAAALETAGPSLFGRESHMYGLWFPTSLRTSGRSLILVGDTPEKLESVLPLRRSETVEEVTGCKNGQVTWRLYYRVVY